MAYKKNGNRVCERCGAENHVNNMKKTIGLFSTKELCQKCYDEFKCDSRDKKLKSKIYKTEKKLMKLKSKV